MFSNGKTLFGGENKHLKVTNIKVKDIKHDKRDSSINGALKMCLSIEDII
jgi:hypothetical protein